MELCQLFIIEVYTIFQDLYIIVNLYISKEYYLITIKQYKKN